MCGPGCRLAKDGLASPPMLQLRPSCAHCDSALPPDSDEAMLCSFECTFCRDCVAWVLQGVCPSCGGNFASRPIRPVTAWREGKSLGDNPASKERVHKPVDQKAHGEFVVKVRGEST